LGLQDDSERHRRRKTDPDDQPHSDRSHSRKKRPSSEVGWALRSAYQRMVDEDIPPEMLDLLGKLG